MVVSENTQPMSKLFRTLLFVRLVTAHQNESGRIVFWPVSIKSVILYIVWVVLPIATQMPSFYRLIMNKPSFTYQFSFIFLLFGMIGLFILFPIPFGNVKKFGNLEADL